MSGSPPEITAASPPGSTAVSSPGSTAEESTIRSPPTKRLLAFFYRRKVNDEKRNDDGDEKRNDDGDEKLSTQPDVPLVAFTSLFRFSTRFELFLNLVGLIAAAAAGAAKPLMSLLFGRLTQNFVEFGTTLRLAQSGDAAAQADLLEAATNFRHSSARNATYLVCIGIGMFVCTYIYMFFWVYTGEATAKRVREQYLQAVLRQDIQFFDKIGAGEVTTRIQTDTHLIQQGISEKVAMIVNFLAAFVTGFSLAYAKSWRLALALSSIIPCMIIFGGIMFNALTKYMKQSLDEIAIAGSLAEEVISTIRTVQAFGTQKVLAGLYDEHIDKAYRGDMKAAVWNGGGVAVFFFIIYSAYALAFSFGSTLIIRGQIEPGGVVTVFFAILIGSISLSMLPPETQAINNALAAAAKLYATIDRVPEIDSSSPEGLKPATINGEIKVEDVRFSYPSRPSIEVAKGLNITFRAGKTAALVGTSGSGKSTIISLVERFYDPTSGSVKLDGNDLRSLNLKWLRSQIGLVSQEPTLFNTTIKGNVAHGLINTPYEHASEEERLKLVKGACIKANADGFISKLPNGYDTIVGERGFLLSGGQKQRIAIARAIVSDPRILLLDEATSALDTQSESVVQDALDRAAAGRTTITIAHRLSTIKDADVIYVMGDGLVLESGTHTELIARDGGYARLVHSQQLRGGSQGQEENSEDAEKHEGMEKVVHEEPSLGRANTTHSLASEILKQNGQARGTEGRDSDHSLFYMFKRMALLNREGWKDYAMGAVVASIGGCVWPALGIVFAKGIDVFSDTDLKRLRHDGDRVALWLFIIAIAATGLIAAQNYLFGAAAANLIAKLRSLSFRATLRQDIEFFDRDENSTGGLTSNLSEKPQKVNGLVGVTLGVIVQSMATIVCGVILGIIFTWKLGLVGLACTPVLVSAGYIRLRVVVLKDQANQRAHEDSAQVACEAAGSIRTVASLTREEDCLKIYSESLEEPLRRSNRTALWSNAIFAFSEASSFFIIALIFWYGSVLVSHLEFSTFDFFIGLMSTTFGAIQAGNVFSFVPDVSSAKGAGSDIIKLLDSIPEIDAESTEGKRIDASKAHGHLRIDKVHFRYPTRPGARVLHDLSLNVEPGTYIALVGASGSGKSTIIQLIERFYEPLAGDVYLDGERISELNVQEYRKQLALVSQEPTLYAGTIRFNILLGAIKRKEEVTQEEIEAVCRDANILDFINSLPDGFNTEVGGKGSQLSGGQKQRIAIARALLRNPKVLLLDEATSALDSNSERVVQEALDQAAKGRTTIAIAHRLSSIQNADRIYFIKEGRVSESGTHDQLLAKRGDYWEYVKLQALSSRD